MAGHPYNVAVEDVQTDTAVFDCDYQFNATVKEYLDVAFAEAETLLTTNMPLLLEVSRFLADKSIMSREQFIKILAKYAPQGDISELLPEQLDYRELLFSEINGRVARLASVSSKTFSLNKLDGRGEKGS